jgi:hypothetical protein
MLTTDLRATRNNKSMQLHRNEASQMPVVLISIAYTVISLFVARYLHTLSFHKTRSTALTALFFALFALFFGGLLFRSTY